MEFLYKLGLSLRNFGFSPVRILPPMLHFHLYPNITLISKINKRVLGYIVTISFGCILYCGCFNLFCNVWVFW